MGELARDAHFRPAVEGQVDDAGAFAGRLDEHHSEWLLADGAGLAIHLGVPAGMVAFLNKQKLILAQACGGDARVIRGDPAEFGSGGGGVGESLGEFGDGGEVGVVDGGSGGDL